jgi:hypothetical protein
MIRSLALVFSQWRHQRPGRVRPPADSFLQRLESLGIQPAPAGASPGDLEAWESRHGFDLPNGLRSWLLLADGLEGRTGPLIHPLRAIGPMIRFNHPPGDPLIQPESWYEFGNPGAETVCLDLAYVWPTPHGDAPVFTSGDDQTQAPPLLIAESFDVWLLRMLAAEGRSYWQEADFHPLGDPWTEHRRRTLPPPLPSRLRPLASAARDHLARADTSNDRQVADMLGISTADLEILFRHLQHQPPPPDETGIRP